jgi:GT2 family glycosyltransferase
VSIVVVNYNGGERVSDCVEMVFADSYSAREIFVVDNASTDISHSLLEEIASRHPEITVLWSKQNLGYAGGVNLAMTAARGDYVAVMNMDVAVSTGWLEPLVMFLEEHPEAGAVNPLILLADGKRINAVGQDVHVTGLGFNRRLGRPAVDAGTIPERVSGIQGSAFVVRRALLDRLGGMDATGFLYHEDVNLSWTLQLIGFALYCVPESVVNHDYSLSMYPAKLHLLERNRLAMLLTLLRWSSLLLLAPALIITEAMIWGYCIIRGPSFLCAKLSSYRWVLRRLGKLGERRKFMKSERTVSDWTLLKNLRWAYDWGQFLILGRERGHSRRQPCGGIEKELIDG